MLIMFWCRALIDLISNHFQILLVNRGNISSNLSKKRMVVGKHSDYFHFIEDIINSS